MSALEQDIIEVDPETKEMLKTLVRVGYTFFILIGRSVWPYYTVWLEKSAQPFHVRIAHAQGCALIRILLL